MIPLPGGTGFYASHDCALRVRILKYDESTRLIKVRVLENLNRKLDCRYEEDQEFEFVVPQNEERGLVSFILE